jgi:3-hydroxybutyryl-CoA dehydratase
MDIFGMAPFSRLAARKFDERKCWKMSEPFKTYFFEDLSVGMRESLMKTVMNEDVVGFAELSGDHNPIHLSEHFAKKTRFGERIAHGLYTASLISAVLGMYLPGPGAVYLHQTLNFKGPVKIGDVVTISVEVIELVEKGRRCKLHCEAMVDGKVVLDGEAIVMVPTREAAQPKAAAG